MYVYKRSGSYYFKFVLDGARYRAGGFPTRTLATMAGDAKRRALVDSRIAREYGVRVERAGRAPSLADYLREVYLPQHLPEITEGSQALVKSYARKFTAALGKYPLDALGPSVLNPWRARRLTEVSKRQCVNEERVLSAILNHARRGGVIGSNPMHGWDWSHAPERDFRLVTPEEETRLFRVASPEFRAWIYLALATGMRRGELRGLERSHVDFTRAEIRIKQQKVSRVKVIPLAPATVSYLRGLLRASTPALLAHPDGTLWSKHEIDTAWQRTRRAAKLPGVRFHDLRHTFATRALEVPGSSIPVVGEILGHKAPYLMTMRYVHALPEAKRAAILGMRSPRIGPTRNGHGRISKEYTPLRSKRAK